MDADGALPGAISLETQRDTISCYYQEEQVADALVVKERLLEVFGSEKTEEVVSSGLPVCRLHESLQAVISRMIEGNP